MASVRSDADSPRHPQVEPTTQFISVPGGTIAYDDFGAGPPVICVPSISDVRAEYRFLRPQLVAAGFRVVTMDLRGHGESSAGFGDYSSVAIGTDIITLTRHLQAGPAAVIGTSMAGGSAVWAAAEAPDLVDRLVLISLFVRAHSGDSLLKIALIVLLARPWGPTFWAMYFPNFYPSRKPTDFDRYRAQLKSNLREPGRIEALRAMLIRSDAAVEAHLSDVAAPTLVIMGTKDPDFKNPDEEAQWIASRLHGTVLMVEGVGHYPHAEMPDRVGPEIVRFLSEARRASAA